MSLHRKKIIADRERLLDGIGLPESRPFSPDSFQLEAIESLREGKDTLVIAPTGAGKTFIATQAIRAVVGEGKRAVYTAPLKALSNAKYAEMKKLFEPEYRVGLLTGDRKIDGDAEIVVATTEIYRNELYGSSGSYGLVVLDELHYLSDPQRGPVWEESIILSARSSTLLMLSASISNADEVAEWIAEVRKKEVNIIRVQRRPVPLRYGFLHPELGLIPLAETESSPIGEGQLSGGGLAGGLYPEVARFHASDGGTRPRMRGMRPGRRGSDEGSSGGGRLRRGRR